MVTRSAMEVTSFLNMVFFDIFPDIFLSRICMVRGNFLSFIATIYTEQEADGISFAADGAVRMDITKYELADDAGGKKD